MLDGLTDWLKALWIVKHTPRWVLVLIIIVSGVLTVTWWSGAYFQDRAEKLDVLHRVVGYRFLLLPQYNCRIKDNLILALNQIHLVYADHAEVIALVRMLQERENLLGGLNDLIDTMAAAAGVTPPPRDVTPLGITNPLCMEIHSHPPPEPD